MNSSISLASTLSMRLTAMVLFCLANSAYSLGMRKEEGQYGLPAMVQWSLSLLVRLKLPLMWLQYCPPFSLLWSPGLSMFDHSRLAQLSVCFVLYDHPILLRLFFRYRYILFLSSKKRIRLAWPSPPFAYSLFIISIVLFILCILWRCRWPCVSMRGLIDSVTAVCISSLSRSVLGLFCSFLVLCFYLLSFCYLGISLMVFRWMVQFNFQAGLVFFQENDLTLSWFLLMGGILRLFQVKGERQSLVLVYIQGRMISLRSIEQNQLINYGFDLGLVQLEQVKAYASSGRSQVMRSVVLLDGLLLLGEFELFEHLLDLLVLEHPVEDDACVDDEGDEEEAGESHSPVEPGVLGGQVHPQGSVQQEVRGVGVLDDEDELLEEFLAQVYDEVYVLVEALGVVHAQGQLGLAGVGEDRAGSGWRLGAVHHPVLVALLSLRGLIVEVDEAVADRSHLVYIEVGLDRCLAQKLVGLGGETHLQLGVAVALDSEGLLGNIGELLLAVAGRGEDNKNYYGDQFYHYNGKQSLQQ